MTRAKIEAARKVVRLAQADGLVFGGKLKRLARDIRAVESEHPQSRHERIRELDARYIRRVVRA